MDKVGGLLEYGTVCFYVKILSQIYHVTYDITACDCFELHKEDGTKCVYKPSKYGLFYSSVKNEVVLFTTVEDKINLLVKKRVNFKTS